MKEEEIGKMFQEINDRQSKGMTDMFYAGVLVGILIGLAAAGAIYLVAT